MASTNRRRAAAWMREELRFNQREYEGCGGEIGCTELAEAAAAALDAHVGQGGRVPEFFFDAAHEVCTQHEEGAYVEC